MNQFVRFFVPYWLSLTIAALVFAPTTISAQQATGTTNPALSGNVIMQQEGTQRIASELIGLSVIDLAGKEIGTVSDLILDEDRKVVGLVASVGGLLGFGSKPVGLPWHAVNFERGMNGSVAVVVSLSEEQFAAAPKFVTQAEVKEQQAVEAAKQRAEQEREQTRESLESKTQQSSE